jgi:hypothetical protein
MEERGRLAEQGLVTDQERKNFVGCGGRIDIFDWRKSKYLTQLLKRFALSKRFRNLALKENVSVANFKQSKIKDIYVLSNMYSLTDTRGYRYLYYGFKIVRLTLP